jgi:hypothetical protein
MPTFTCIKPTNFNGFMVQPGREITLAGKKAEILKDNPCWEQKAEPVKQEKTPK